MSDLETAVRPLVGAMITDQPVPLSITDQVAISAWAVKTAMVFECMKEDRQWFYSQEDRDHLRADLSLPENTGVWLGRQQASWAGFAEGKKLSGGTSPEGPALGEGSAFTLSLGHLAVQVFTMRRRPEDQAIPITLNVQPGPWPRALVQICPAEAPVQWPPSLSFDESGLSRLSDRFFAGRRP